MGYRLVASGTVKLSLAFAKFAKQRGHVAEIGN
jgi:hypothetical protein